MKKLLKKILLVLIPLIFFNFPVHSEEDIISIIKSAIEKDYSVSFDDSDAFINSQDNISSDKVLHLKGYGELGAQGQKLARDAAFADLKRNYINFIKGIYFELNSDNDLLLKSSNNVNILKSRVEEKFLPDISVYLVEMTLQIPENTRNYSGKLPSVIAVGFSEMTEGKSILDAYNEAKNTAIIKGLKVYYGNFKSNRKGKIIFQKILYNSLNSTVKNSDKFVYALQFGIDETAGSKRLPPLLGI